MNTNIIEKLQSDKTALQSKIDALMLEFCPERMDQAQIDEWAKHQKPETAKTVLKLEWISVDKRIPELVDDSILVYFANNNGIDMVHIQDYFTPITDGFDSDGNQLYTKWYLSQGVSHWMPLPVRPSNEAE